MSLAEATVNVAVATQLLLSPLRGLSVRMQDNLIIGSIFTGVSLLRSYLLRRIFERLRT
jgi:hypothetical protein